jgi:hypothetical protein
MISIRYAYDLLNDNDNHLHSLENILTIYWEYITGISYIYYKYIENISDPPDPFFLRISIIIFSPYSGGVF